MCVCLFIQSINFYSDVEQVARLTRDHKIMVALCNRADHYIFMLSL